MALAAAFNVDVSTLLTGHSREDLASIAEDYTCGSCGAQLVERRYVENEFGDCEIEVFACGSMRGWQWRPCPVGLEFPSFEDYELHCHQDGDGYICCPRGKTDAARAVDLGHGLGPNRAEAERQVRWTYLATRYDWETAERELGPRCPGPG
jgi:hypothetical protein